MLLIVIKYNYDCDGDDDGGDDGGDERGDGDCGSDVEVIRGDGDGYD